MVLLPTPPLPDPTAMTLLAASPMVPSFCGGRSWILGSIVTRLIAGKRCRINCSNSATVSCHSGAEWVVRAKVRDKRIAVDPHVAHLLHLRRRCARFPDRENRRPPPIPSPDRSLPLAWILSMGYGAIRSVENCYSAHGSVAKIRSSMDSFPAPPAPATADKPLIRRRTISPNSDEPPRRGDKVRRSGLAGRILPGGQVSLCDDDRNHLRELAIDPQQRGHSRCFFSAINSRVTTAPGQPGRSGHNSLKLRVSTNEMPCGNSLRNAAAQRPSVSQTMADISLFFVWFLHHALNPNCTIRRYSLGRVRPSSRAALLLFPFDSRRARWISSVSMPAKKFSRLMTSGCLRGCARHRRPAAAAWANRHRALRCRPRCCRPRGPRRPIRQFAPANRRPRGDRALPA